MQDPLFERGLPANLDAERFILGSILLGASLAEFRAILTIDDFAIEKHRRIYRVACDLAEMGESIDRVTVTERLMARGQLESVDGIGYLNSLDDGMPQASHAEAYVRIVKDKSTLRRTILQSHALIEACYSADDTPDAILVRAEKILRALGDERQTGPGLRNAFEIMNSHPGGVDAFLEPHKGDSGIPTPWGDVNAIAGGLKKGRMITVAARPGVGKSALCTQIARFAAQRGYRPAVFSLEMGSDEILHRMICGMAGVDCHAFQVGAISGQQRTMVNRAARELCELPIKFDDRAGNTIPSIHAALRKMQAKEGVDLAIIDYLQLLKSVGKYGKREEEVAEMSRGIKLLAKEFQIPILVAAQFNREPEKERREPRISDIRESGAIEQDSDQVWLLSEDGESSEDAITVPVRLKIAKNRGGRRGKVDMLFMKQFLTFEMSARGMAA
jgi:replicative DNA helicase